MSATPISGPEKLVSHYARLTTSGLARGAELSRSSDIRMVRDWMDRRAMARSGRDGSAFTENAVGYGRKVIHSARYTSAARLGQVRMAARNFATVVGQLTQ